jgi:phage/plasmid primase-like uncharacterized protein
MALHEKYPQKPIMIAGDDDKHLEATQGMNPGKTKAEEAPRAVGGKAIFPIFAPHEQTTENAKGFTDFNDLATRSCLGREGIERQVRAVVESAVKHHAGVCIEQKAARKVRRVGNADRTRCAGNHNDHSIPRHTQSGDSSGLTWK